jgi:hypothetical protein
MEIAYDLATHGANTSIVIRSPVCALYNLFGYKELGMRFYYYYTKNDILFYLACCKDV